MAILEVIKNRRSIRSFQKKEIPKNVLDKLIEALIWAPSAGNLQSRKFYFVQDKQIQQKLARAALNQVFIAQAPLVVVACTDDRIARKYGERGKKLYSICDTAMAIQNLMLLAHHLGFGSCPVGAFVEEKVSEILSLPKNLHPILIVPIGYPAEKPLAPPRVSKKEAVKEI